MASERVRLHITPFNPDLLDRYIPPSLKSQATGISFHSVATFPEKGFGYVELPTMEAQKLKKKLNGSTLKGAKVKIEEARPEKKRKVVEEEDEEEKKTRKKAKKEKKKREDGVIPGHELEEGRHVKRGWTEGPGRAKKSKKDGLEGKKMKFKTEVPLNKTAVDEKKEKKSKSKAKTEEKEKKAKTGKKAAVVKEFSKTTKVPTVSAKGDKKATSYEEGVGWVDEDGNVVEAEPPSKKRRRIKAAAEAEAKSAPAKEPAQEPTPEPDSDSASGTSSSSSSESESEEAPSDESSISDHENTLDRQLSEAKSNTERNASAERDQQNSIPITPATSAPKEVHPLEALYKRPAPSSDDLSKPEPTPIDTSFSFFGGGNAEDEDEVMVENLVPQTPRTKEDLEWRSNRSAAPTPDTAAIGKRFDFAFGAENQEEEDDTEMADAEIENSRGGADGEKGEESEFRKWFYENRGDLNRGWKKRRREERKIVRQRENRRLNRRIA